MASCSVSTVVIVAAMALYGCAAPAPVDSATRARAGGVIGGEWTRTAADLANPAIQSKSARFDPTTGDGSITYKAGYTNRLQLTGMTPEGAMTYADNMNRPPVNYTCRVAAGQSGEQRA